MIYSGGKPVNPGCSVWQQTPFPGFPERVTPRRAPQREMPMNIGLVRQKFQTPFAKQVIRNDVCTSPHVLECVVFARSLVSDNFAFYYWQIFWFPLDINFCPIAFHSLCVGPWDVCGHLEHVCMLSSLRSRRHHGGPDLIVPRFR